MKKMILIALVFALLLCGCAAPAQTSSNEAEAQAAPAADMVEKAELDKANSRISELESEIDGLKKQLQSAQDEISSYQDEIKTYQDAQAAKENGAVAPIENAVQFHDDEYVTISYLGCEKDDRDQTQIVLLVQNKTDYTLTFQASSIALDGFDLGYPSGSDDVAPQSKGKVHFRVDEDPESMTPSTFSSTLRVIDFSKEMTGNQHYNVTVVNVDVSSING